ncbi:MAG: hypothetical protein HKN39_07875 [Flavobacteriales bacterium]|nr:hypothetical protein [Flavobacteriales bacterium]
MSHHKSIKASLCLIFFLVPFFSVNAQISGSSQGNSYLTFEQLEQISNYSTTQLAKTRLLLADHTSETHSFKIIPNSLLDQISDTSFHQIKTYDLIGEDGLKDQGKLTIGNGLIMVYAMTDQGLISMNNSDIDLSSIPQMTKSCNVDDLDYKNNKYNPLLKSATDLSYGSELRIFNLAVIATGEFYSANGANVATVNTIITNSVNSLNLIYGNELSINFSLLTPVIFTDPSTDPFTPDIPSGTDNRTEQAAEAIAANFALGDYDIGHVFHNTSTGTLWTEGGIASIEAACDDTTSPQSGTGANKGAGWSGSPENISIEWTQIVAHEIGHQLGATHTFNGIGGSCDVYNIEATTSYEIGSGTTIMAYNGLCEASQNIPSSGADDNHFHAVSLDQISEYVGTLSCNSSISTGNTPPDCEANPSGSIYEIPIGTPFELTGVASDADFDELTYSWDGYDEDGSFIFTQGKIGNAAATDPSAPLFRSMPPTLDKSRTFPDLDNILTGNNNGDDFEALPLVDRTLKFILVVRDNNPAGGGVCTSPITIDVDDYEDPFELSSQNTPTTWVADGISTTTISWNGGDEYGYSECDDFEILFSVDGGQTFPYTLATNVPFENIDDDLEYELVIPFLPTTQGRIKMKCSSSIYFDINDSDITITSSSCSANGAMISPSSNVSAPAGDPALDLSLSPNFGTLFSSFIGTLESTDPPTDLSFNDGGTCVGPANDVVFDEHFFQVDVSGSYTFTFDGGHENRIFNLYNQPYDPLNVCSGWLGSSGNLVGALVDPQDFGSYSLSPNTDYYLVVSSFNTTTPTLPSAYEIDVTGPGSVFSGPPEPAGSSYGYFVINELTGIVEEFTTDPDLSNSAVFTGGEFKVYGVSYESSLDLSSYEGGTFSTLTSAITSLTICAQLSNSICVTINGDLCDLSIEDADGDGVCDDFDQCPGVDDSLDSDGDGIPDCIDLCFGSSAFDSDGDGFCNGYDCQDYFFNEDLNNDNIPDGCSCNIYDPEFGVPGSCNNNGTVGNAYDDFFLIDITVNFYGAPAGGTLRIFDYDPQTYDQVLAASVPVANLDGPTQHTFIDVPVFASEFDPFLEIEFLSSNGFTVTCSNFLSLNISVPECSCQEISIEFTSIECVDVDGTPYDTSDDEIQYTYIATKGTGGMGTSTEGDYGLVEDCFGDGETFEGDCDGLESEGTFGQVGQATTSTNAANGGGSRKFTVSYDEGCFQDFEFPDLDDFPGITTPCCIPPMFTGEITCVNDITGVDAGFDEFYVKVVVTDTGSENGDVVATAGGLSSTIMGGIGTAFIGPLNYIDGTTIIEIELGIVGAPCTIVAEVLEHYCGYTVNAPGGDGEENDLNEDGSICSEQNGKTIPAVSFQYSLNAIEPLDSINFLYYYILTETSTGTILDINNSGFFESVDDLTSYTVYADSIFDPAEVVTLFPIGSIIDLANCADCESLIVDVECDECPSDPLKMFPGICGCSNPEPGTPCDDGDPTTQGDVIQEDCNCSGSLVSENISLIDPCSCLNNATTSENGQFSEVVQIESLAGESWVVVNSSGFYSMSSPSPALSPIPINLNTPFVQGDLDGFDNDENGVIDNVEENIFYTLQGIHVDGLGYYIQASNGSETANVFNTCYYPEIVLELFIELPIGNFLFFENLPYDLTGPGTVINGATGDPAIGNAVYDLYDASGNLIEANITAIPDYLNLGSEYILVCSFSEDEVLPITPPGPGTPGCLQESTFEFKVVSNGCD